MKEIEVFITKIIISNFHRYNNRFKFFLRYYIIYFSNLIYNYITKELLSI